MNKSAEAFREKYRKRCRKVCLLLSHVNLQAVLEHSANYEWVDEIFSQEAEELAASCECCC